MQNFLSAAGLLGSVLLVGITAWYAWQTQQMVREMRAGRLAGVRPDVRLDPEIWPGNVMMRVDNVGVGPALDVHVTLTAESRQLGERDAIDWHTPILRPGEYRLLNFPLGGGRSLQALYDGEFQVGLKGTCRDLYGASHVLSDAITFDATTRRDHELVDEPAMDRLANSLKHVAKDLEGIRKAVERLGRS